MSIIDLAICKIIYRSNLQVCGMPIRARLSNIDNVRGGMITIGSRINISNGTKFICTKGGFLKIGDRVYFNRNCNVVCRDHIEIGNGCRFGPNVSIFDHDHEYGLAGVTDNYKIGCINIGDNCWFGANAVVLRGSTIGEGCIIGAGVVFKGQLPPHSLVYNNRNNIIIKMIQPK